jgi:hypothetical protein
MSVWILIRRGLCAATAFVVVVAGSAAAATPSAPTLTISRIAVDRDEAHRRHPPANLP